MLAQSVSRPSGEDELLEEFKSVISEISTAVARDAVTPQLAGAVQGWKKDLATVLDKLDRSASSLRDSVGAIPAAYRSLADAARNVDSQASARVREISSQAEQTAGRMEALLANADLKAALQQVRDSMTQVQEVGRAMSTGLVPRVESAAGSLSSSSQKLKEVLNQLETAVDGQMSTIEGQLDLVAAELAGIVDTAAQISNGVDGLAKQASTMLGASARTGEAVARAYDQLKGLEVRLSAVSAHVERIASSMNSQFAGVSNTMSQIQKAVSASAAANANARQANDRRLDRLETHISAVGAGVVQMQQAHNAHAAQVEQDFGALTTRLDRCADEALRRLDVLRHWLVWLTAISVVCLAGTGWLAWMAMQAGR